MSEQAYNKSVLHDESRNLHAQGGGVELKVGECCDSGVPSSKL
jgi:hypothetical protein